MQGALRQWGAPVTVDRLDAFVKTDMCLAHLAATGERSEHRTRDRSCRHLRVARHGAGHLVPGSAAEISGAQCDSANRPEHRPTGLSGAQHRGSGFALLLGAFAAAGPTPVSIVVAFGVAFAALAVQLIAVRPRLTRRSDQVLAGLDAPRSHGHYAYVGFEVVKVAALVTAGILLLNG